MRFFKSLGVLLFCLISLFSLSQNTATIYGKITDSRNRPLELVNIAIMGQSGGNVTDRQGLYEIKVPADIPIVVVFSYIGFQSERISITLFDGESRQVNKMLQKSTTELSGFVVEDKQVRNTNLTRIDPREASVIPTVSGNAIENILKTLPGVASTNELSSQYSVRGGNYDENLVYVNDIEIYRPFLIRSGQQEGLSFLNSDLVSSIQFSAGGFDAKYGDKMSSVLDIQYRKPVDFRASMSFSLLGANMHLEGLSPNRKLSYLVGLRQKSNQYVLNSLDTEGEYKPSFTDLQSLITYSFSPKLELSLLAYYSLNSYKLIPETRETAFGAINEAYKFTVYFEGQEVDRFQNLMGAASLKYILGPSYTMKFIASAYQTDETETYDILGQYWIARLETDWSNDEFGEPTETLGVGSYLEHARNELIANVTNLEWKNSYSLENHYLQWGVKYQNERINDQLKEWELNDSTGYSLPHPQDSIGYTEPELQNFQAFELQQSVSASVDLNTSRYMAYIQDTWNVFETDSNRLSLTGGFRLNYWDYNDELIFSPRFSLAYHPAWDHDVVFRLSSGFYYQPPFYRELRDDDGIINPEIKAQKSIHIVAGSDYNFFAWGRPFKFVSEIYYKYLDNLIPYTIDNVRIRYSATNSSHGYATGIDLKVNGEFVKGVESWASLSLLKTEEDIEDDSYINDDGLVVYPAYIRRPTDQRINFGLFFQDYLPSNPTYKMHLTFFYGTNLPFGPPDSEKYKHVFKSSPYLRVDVGFSKLIIGEGSLYKPKNFMRFLKSLWISAEVFNLLQHENTVSYQWIKDINNFQYPVPNRSTPRQLNIRLVAEF